MDKILKSFQAMQISKKDVAKNRGKLDSFFNH